MRALYDGDDIAPWETVMTIEGDYTLFAHLETVYLGVLTRRTLISTNVRRVVDAAGDKPIFFFPARFDHYRVQAGDGWAAHIAGAIGVSTDEQASWWGGKGGGTVPHGLIAAYGGDTVAASEAFADVLYPDVNVIALVDFDNDCVATSLACARALGERLWGVRLDTSETMVDRSLWEGMGQFRPTGVNPELVRNVRRALDAEGFDARAHRGERRVRRRAHRRVRAREACRPTPTASARACCAASSTLRPTSCGSTAGPAPKRAASSGLTRASSSSGRRCCATGRARRAGQDLAAARPVASFRARSAALCGARAAARDVLHEVHEALGGVADARAGVDGGRLASTRHAPGATSAPRSRGPPG